MGVGHLFADCFGVFSATSGHGIDGESMQRDSVQDGGNQQAHPDVSPHSRP